MKPIPKFQLHTAQSRPDLWDALQDPSHPLNDVWPEFLGNDLSQKYYSDTFTRYHGLRKFQYAIVETDTLDGPEIVIACARSIPFYWPDLEKFGSAGGSLDTDILHSLPDGGYDTIVARGMQQYFIREGLSTSSLPTFTKEQDQDVMRTCQGSHRPNALSALSITVRPDRRRLGLAERLIDTMRQTAREEHLQILVTPLRPTRKAEFPFTPMEDYLSWTCAQNASSRISTARSFLLAGKDTLASKCCSNSPNEPPFDPWLKKHIQLGACIVKVAPSSMVVQGSFPEWQAWTGIDFHYLLRQTHPEELRIESETMRTYIEIVIPGGLVPLRVYTREKLCIYTEPNVWIYHEV